MKAPRLDLVTWLTAETRTRCQHSLSASLPTKDSIPRHQLLHRPKTASLTINFYRPKPTSLTNTFSTDQRQHHTINFHRPRTPFPTINLSTTIVSKQLYDTPSPGRIFQSLRLHRAFPNGIHTQQAYFSLLYLHRLFFFYKKSAWVFRGEFKCKKGVYIDIIFLVWLYYKPCIYI